MKRALKIFGMVLVGLLACLGLPVCIVAAQTVWANHDLPKFCHVGAEALEASAACAPLPLPEQENATLFPMAVSSYGLLPGQACAMVVFRAPDAWQEDFRRFYPLRPELAGRALEELAREDFGADFDDKRIADFIREREWLPFHAGVLRPDELYVDALRDRSGEYLLLSIFP